MFIRFIVRKQNEHSRSYAGLLSEAYNLRGSTELESYEFERLEKALSWMRQNLNIPECLKQSGYERAISWFKPEAKKPLEWAWELVHLLEDHGVRIEMIKSSDPGTVVYEDGWQVVAIPRRKNRIRSAKG